MKHTTAVPTCTNYRAPGFWRQIAHTMAGSPYCEACMHEHRIALHSLEARSWAIENSTPGNLLALAAYDAGREARIDARPPRTYRAHGSKPDTAPVTTVPSDINTPPRRWQAPDGRPLLDYAAIGTTLLSQNHRPVGSMTPEQHTIATVIEALGRALITLGPHE
jgi:hypothetical protein